VGCLYLLDVAIDQENGPALTGNVPSRSNPETETRSFMGFSGDPSRVAVISAFPEAGALHRQLRC